MAVKFRVISLIESKKLGLNNCEELIIGHTYTGYDQRNGLYTVLLERGHWFATARAWISGNDIEIIDHTKG